MYPVRSGTYVTWITLSTPFITLRPCHPPNVPVGSCQIWWRSDDLLGRFWFCEVTSGFLMSLSLGQDHPANVPVGSCRRATITEHRSFRQRTWSRRSNFHFFDLSHHSSFSNALYHGVPSWLRTFFNDAHTFTYLKQFLDPIFHLD